MAEENQEGGKGSLKVVIQFENDSDRQMLGVSAGIALMSARVTAVLVRNEAVPINIFGGTGFVYKKYLELEIGSLEEVEERPGALRLLEGANDSDTKEAVAREDGEAEQPLDSSSQTGDDSLQDRQQGDSPPESSQGR